MSYRNSRCAVQEANAKRAPARPTISARWRASLARRGVDIEALDDQGRRLRRRRADLGRRHRRHALRPISRPRRAARHLRQARGLRDHPATDARHADLSRRIFLGTRSTTTRELAETRRSARPRLSTPSTPTRFRTNPASRSPTSSARSRTPNAPCAIRRSRTISNASRSAANSARRR